jgi:ADP-heptose:LPS heptosyltransferase
MVEWVDRYGQEIFGLPPSETPLRLTPPADWQPDADRHRRVLVFPTTPNPSKNYSLRGFSRLVARLESAGWLVDVICMTNEVPQVAAVFGASRTKTFPTLRELILQMMQSHAVISNDSGGGHLGSMLGLATYTITKKTADFVWRPGFNDDNQVICPTMTFKWITGRVWRPFIPLGRIVASLGKPVVPRQTA